MVSADAVVARRDVGCRKAVTMSRQRAGCEAARTSVRGEEGAQILKLLGADRQRVERREGPVAGAACSVGGGQHGGQASCGRWERCCSGRRTELLLSRASSGRAWGAQIAGENGKARGLGARCTKAE